MLSQAIQEERRHQRASAVPRGPQKRRQRVVIQPLASMPDGPLLDDDGWSGGIEESFDDETFF